MGAPSGIVWGTGPQITSPTEHAELERSSSPYLNVWVAGSACQWQMSQFVMLEMPALRVLILLVGAAIIVIVTRKRSKKALPSGTKALPGPKGWPLIGNVLDIPKSHAWLKFKEWADEYGPIYQVDALGTTLVIISSESIANDLLSLRGALYSDRPPLIMPSLISDNGFLGAVRWSDHWRRGRKFAQAMLSSSNVREIVPKQTTEARQMVVDLAREPARYAYWLERAGVMASVKQIYGLSEERGAAEERHVGEVCSYMEEIDRTAAPGQYLVELIPVLMKLPTWLAPFKREAQALVDKHWRYLAPLMDHENKRPKDQLAADPKSFSRRYVESKEDWRLTDREMVWVLSSIYGGGSGTSATAMQSIILNTCLFPKWQQRLQEEIERVVGDQRLPDINDVSNLPTVRAVIKESMRWRPVLSGGFPHALIKDDVYQGYHIPAGAVIIPNQWAIFRDNEQYPDPDSFNPDRWLTPSFPTYQEPLTKYPNLARFAAFGHGRRICPGLEVAEKALFLEVASLYWACNIRPAKDSQGRDVRPPWYDYTGVAISNPRRFPFMVEERAKGRLAMMEAAASADHAEELSRGGVRALA